MPVQLGKFYKSCSVGGKTPLIIFRDDPHLPTNQITALANKLHVRECVFTYSSPLAVCVSLPLPLPLPPPPIPLSLQIPLTVVCVHGTGETEMESVRAIISLTSSQGGWLLLHNIQVSTTLPYIHTPHSQYNISLYPHTHILYAVWHIIGVSWSSSSAALPHPSPSC